MDTGSEEIKDTIKSIYADKLTLSKQELDEKYTEFKTKFVKLYETCTESEITEESMLKEIDMMLQVRQEHLDGKISNIAGNIKIGQLYATKYIYPVTGKPSKKDVATAIDKLLKSENKDKL